MGRERVHAALKQARVYDRKDESRIYDLDGIHQRFGGTSATILTCGRPCELDSTASRVHADNQYDGPLKL